MVAPGVWLGLASVILVIRRCVEHATGQSSDEVRYFISSLPAKVKRLAGAVRQHRGIENGLHCMRPADHVLDLFCRLEARPFHWEKPHACIFVRTSGPSSELRSSGPLAATSPAV
jgi:hypothetical protein